MSFSTSANWVVYVAGWAADRTTLKMYRVPRNRLAVVLTVVGGRRLAVRSGGAELAERRPVTEVGLDAGALCAVPAPVEEVDRVRLVRRGDATSVVLLERNAQVRGVAVGIDVVAVEQLRARRSSACRSPACGWYFLITPAVPPTWLQLLMIGKCVVGLHVKMLISCCCVSPAAGA